MGSGAKSTAAWGAVGTRTELLPVGFSVQYNENLLTHLEDVVIPKRAC